MGTKKRTVSFYRLNIVKTMGDESRTISHSEVKEYADHLYESMKPLHNNNRAKQVSRNDKTYVLEVIERDRRYSFVKIGRATAVNTMGIREKEELEWEDIDIDDSKTLETYTYCLIDYETCIISFIGVIGAPNVRVVETFFKDDNPEMNASVPAIISENMVETLCGKDIVTKTLVKVAVPSDTVLRDLGMRRGDFDELSGVKETTETFVITGQRNKNIFKNGNNFRKFIDAIFGNNNNVKKVEVTAKDSYSGESSETYDLLNYKVVQHVYLDVDCDHDELIQEEFKKALKNTYSSKRSELIRYSK